MLGCRPDRTFHSKHLLDTRNITTKFSAPKIHNLLTTPRTAYVSSHATRFARHLGTLVTLTQTMSFYAKHSHHHRGIFVVAALGLAGLCSLFPLMCFKGVSSKEKARLRKDVADLEEQQKKDEKWIRENAPRVRHRSHSPSRIALTPHHDHHHHRRRHSTDHRRRRHHEDDGPQSPRRHRRMSESRHANDRHLDQERRRRHHGHPPPRRYHHSSWEGVLGPMPAG